VEIRRLALAAAPLFAAACGASAPLHGDGGAGDLGAADLASGDGGGCLASTPPTQLYQDPCSPTSGTFCLIDHPPTDFF